MALKTSDTITVRRQTAIWLTQYDAIKPSVTLTRVLGDDPEADRADMDRTLYVELRRAVLMELEDRSELDDALERNVTTLIKHCERVIEDGPQGQSASEGEDFPRRKQGGKKKVARKKARRKRRE